MALPALIELRDQGSIGAVGVGMKQWQVLRDFALHAGIDCVLLAGRYTLLEQGALPLLTRCEERGIGVLLGGVFHSGILATGARPGARYNDAPAPPTIAGRVARIEAICRRFDVALPTAAIQFPLAHPAVAGQRCGRRCARRGCSIRRRRRRQPERHVRRFD